MRQKWKPTWNNGDVRNYVSPAWSFNRRDNLFLKIASRIDRINLNCLKQLFAKTSGLVLSYEMILRTLVMYRPFISWKQSVETLVDSLMLASLLHGRNSALVSPITIWVNEWMPSKGMSETKNSSKGRNVFETLK